MLNLWYFNNELKSALLPAPKLEDNAYILNAECIEYFYASTFKFKKKEIIDYIK